MTLPQKQKIFSLLVARLIIKAYDLGYEITLGEAWRPSATAEYYANTGKGIKNSLHTQRLAIDINLFKDGKYLKGKKGYDELGEWWINQGKKEGVETCWGGFFSKLKDYCHFSVSHNNIK